MPANEMDPNRSFATYETLSTSQRKVTLFLGKTCGAGRSCKSARPLLHMGAV